MVNLSRNRPRLKSGVVDELDDVHDRHSGAGGIVTLHENAKYDLCQSPESVYILDAAPVRFYWVKNQDDPVDYIFFDITHESDFLLRSKAL